MTATALVLYMTLPGLSLFYGGLVRSKNVLSVLMQCFTIACVMSLLWLLVGYSLAFGDGGSLNAFIGGLDNVLLAQIGEGTESGTIPESVFALFQMTFAVITPALIVGGFAERCASLRCTVLVSLADSGLRTDLPLGLGRRLAQRSWRHGFCWRYRGAHYRRCCCSGCGHGAGQSKVFPSQACPHNMTLAILGAGMLWVGWFGFNGGSALAANGDAGMAMLVTHISAAAGACTWMLLERINHGKASALGAVTGMVAGLGTITPASGFVGPGGGLIIGLSAGFVCYYATGYIKRTLKIDDSLDVFPVHGVGGILGTLLTGVFASNALGVFSGQQDIAIGAQVSAQAIGIAAAVVYTAGVTFVILKMTDALVGNRVDDEDEMQGLDLVSHDERGYDL